MQLVDKNVTNGTRNKQKIKHNFYEKRRFQIRVSPYCVCILFPLFRYGFVDRHIFRLILIQNRINFEF